MRAPALALCVLLSAAPLALEALGMLDVHGSPRLGIALLPWLALAGLPSSRRAPRGAHLEAAALFALPVVLVAALADARAASAALLAAGQWTALGAGILAIALLAAAAARGGRIYSGAWILTVAGPPALAAAFRASADGAGAGRPAFLGALLDANPVLWATELATGAEAAPLSMLALASLLVAAALADARSESEPRGADA